MEKLKELLLKTALYGAGIYLGFYFLVWCASFINHLLQCLSGDCITL